MTTLVRKHVSINFILFDNNKEIILIGSCTDLNTLVSGWFWRFSQKNKQQFSVALPTP